MGDVHAEGAQEGRQTCCMKLQEVHQRTATGGRLRWPQEGASDADMATFDVLLWLEMHGMLGHL
jgi:hypothetical protein